jgi:hypothetical protein
MAKGRGRPAQAKEPVLSKEEQIAKLQAEVITDHRAEETKKIEDTKCSSCGAKLGLKAEEYMHPGVKRESVECDKCDIINDVIIAYPGNGHPDTDFCTIEVIKGGYKWQQSGIKLHELSDKQVRSWYDNEMKAVEDGTSRLPFEVQVLFRLMK